MRLQTLLAGCAMTLILASSASAERYRLGVGDQVIVDYDFLDNAKQTTVDLDGEIRLLGLGSIAVAGQTLDEVEDTIRAGMEAEGFSGNALVSVEIATYAPVVVTGDVSEIGRFEYLPGMTIGSAIALAGGLGNDLTGPAAEPLAFAANRRAAEAIDGLIRHTVTVAKLEAALAGTDTPMRDIGAIPGAPAALVSAISAEANQLLAAERRQAESLLASLDAEIADFTEQMGLLDQRIEVKADSITILEEEFGSLEELRSQGLTTNARTSALQQRLSDDREELLALEVAKVQARRNRALAERRRDEFEATQLAEMLTQLSGARASLAAAERNLELAREEILMVSGMADSLTALDDVFVPVFRVEGPRAARLNETELSLATPLLPSDILNVTLEDNPG